MSSFSLLEQVDRLRNLASVPGLPAAIRVRIQATRDLLSDIERGLKEGIPRYGVAAAVQEVTLSLDEIEQAIGERRRQEVLERIEVQRDILQEERGTALSVLAGFAPPFPVEEDCDRPRQPVLLPLSEIFPAWQGHGRVSGNIMTLAVDDGELAPHNATFLQPGHSIQVAAGTVLRIFCDRAEIAPEARVLPYAIPSSILSAVDIVMQEQGKIHGPAVFIQIGSFDPKAILRLRETMPETHSGEGEFLSDTIESIILISKVWILIAAASLGIAILLDEAGLPGRDILPWLLAIPPVLFFGFTAVKKALSLWRKHKAARLQAHLSRCGVGKRLLSSPRLSRQEGINLQPPSRIMG